MRIEYLADRPEYVSALAVWHRREWGNLRSDESVEARATKLRAWSGHRQIPTVFIATVAETLLGSAMLVAHDMDTKMQWTPWLAGVVVARNVADEASVRPWPNTLPLRLVPLASRRFISTHSALRSITPAWAGSELNATAISERASLSCRAVSNDHTSNTYNNNHSP